MLHALCHAARELATVFSIAFFSNNSWSIGQNASPPQQKVPQHITGYHLFLTFEMSKMQYNFEFARFKKTW